jgi:hypothetical protein
MYIPDSTDYARLAWLSGTAGYPVGLTLGNLSGASADVLYAGNDEPFYMLSFHDSTNLLGAGAGDQILMIEFQSSTLTGNSLILDPNGTKFNLIDNVTGVYLQGGQQDTNTLSGWLTLDPFLAGDSLEQIRIGIGLSGGDSGPVSATVNSLDVTTPAVPEPTALLLLLTFLGFTGLGITRRTLRTRRS